MKKADGRAFGLVPLVYGFGGGGEIDSNALFLEILGGFFRERHHAVLARAMMSRSAPFSKMYSASSSERV